MTNCHWMETQNLVISFDYSWFLVKNLAYDECWIMKFHYRNSSNVNIIFIDFYTNSVSCKSYLYSRKGITEKWNGVDWFWQKWLNLDFRSFCASKITYLVLIFNQYYLIRRRSFNVKFFWYYQFLNPYIVKMGPILVSSMPLYFNKH